MPPVVHQGCQADRPAWMIHDGLHQKASKSGWVGRSSQPDIVRMCPTPGQSVLAPARILLVPRGNHPGRRGYALPRRGGETVALQIRMHSRFNMAHMNEAAIDVSDVHKTCKGRVHALRGVTMRVERGEVFGLLGPTALEKARWSRS